MKTKNNIKKKFLHKILLLAALLFTVNISSETKDSLSASDIRELQEAKLGSSIEIEEEKFLELQTSVVKEEEEECLDCIFGYDFFSSIPTTFALSSNVPVPQDYILGPGDKIKVEYFGNTQESFEGYIPRSGIVNLPLLGPLSLVGKDYSFAQKEIETKVKNELIGTDVFLSLSELRSINVYVVGAAYKPGTYTVSSLASLTNIIFSTGGPSQEGSLRNITLKRDGKIIYLYDFYELLLSGNTATNFRLRDGDTIFYPLLENTIRIDGFVRRSGLFEIKEGETIDDIIKFSGLKSTKQFKVQFSRYETSLNKRDVKLVDSLEILRGTVLEDGDSINILSNSQQVISNVFLSGEISYPGYYDISAGETITEVLLKAGGYTEQAYPEASIFTRKAVKEQQKESFLSSARNLEKSLIDAVSSGSTIDGEAYNAINSFINNLKEIEPSGRQVVVLDEYTLSSDPKADFSLQDGDTLHIPKRPSSVSVVGEVLNASTHLFDEDLSVDDYIELSGGSTDGADLSKIFVILPNGQSLVYKRKLFQRSIDSQIIPGSTIVVTRNPDPYNWLKLASVITPVLSDLAVSAAAISTISDNN